jgi:hypothetical protein
MLPQKDEDLAVDWVGSNHKGFGVKALNAESALRRSKQLAFALEIGNEVLRRR